RISTNCEDSMKSARLRFSLSRRQFAFWVGFGLFQLGEAFGSDQLDRLAAATMRATEPPAGAAPPTKPEHWTAAENNAWRWFEREHLIEGRWKLTGITTPIHKRTGERYTGHTGYLDDSLVPESVRRGEQPVSESIADDTAVEDDPGQPSAA